MHARGKGRAGARPARAGGAGALDSLGMAHARHPLLGLQRSLGNQAVLAELELEPRNVSGLVAESVGPTGEPRVHRDHRAALIAEAHDAEAVTIGSDVFLARPDVPRHVLGHELAHTEQARRPGTPAPRGALEHEAHQAGARWNGAGVPGVALSAPPDAVLRHPAIRTLLRGGQWLARRTTNTLSKHVARHGRRMAGRAVHSVFRNPRKIKSLVTSAVDDGAKLARKYATQGADDVLEEGGVRVLQQPTGVPGKVRTVVEKDFGRAVGTRGETAIRVVLDSSGRVVTAFPIGRALAVGGGAVAMSAFTSHTAEAAEGARAAIERHENRPTDWGAAAIELTFDILSFGLLASTPANEGESLHLELDRLVWQAAEDTIRDIEASEGITLTDEQKGAIRELAAVAIGSPMEFEGVAAEAEAASPPSRYIRDPDGMMHDTQTGRSWLGPGPKF